MYIDWYKKEQSKMKKRKRTIDKKEEGERVFNKKRK